MERANDAIQWYQQKIGNYDKQPWERNVEESVSQSQNINKVPRRLTRLKSELIDVDLIRGSTFQKAKPQHGWLVACRKGLTRVLLLPLYYRWWQRQTSPRLFILLVTLYSMQLTAVSIYLTDNGENVNVENAASYEYQEGFIGPMTRPETLSLSHLVMPGALMIILGLLHMQIVTTQHASPPLPRMLEKPRKLEMKRSARSNGSCVNNGAGSRQGQGQSSDATMTDCDMLTAEIVERAHPGGSSSCSPSIRSNDSVADLFNAALVYERSGKCLRDAVSADMQATLCEEQQSPSEETLKAASDDDGCVTETMLGNGTNANAGYLNHAPLTQLRYRHSELQVDYNSARANDREMSEDMRTRSAAFDTQRMAHADSSEKIFSFGLSSFPSFFGSTSATETTDADWRATESDTSENASSCGSPDCKLSASNGFTSNTDLHPASSVLHSMASSYRVNCIIWEERDVKKVSLSPLDIAWSIVEKVEKRPDVGDFIVIGALLSGIVMATPLTFRLYHQWEQFGAGDNSSISFQHLFDCCCSLLGHSWKEQLIVVNGIIQRFFLCGIFFFLLAVAERTYKQRLLHAKYFCHLTSSRRAKKHGLPHFRLNKLLNIRMWLSLRSYLKKRGPQRSVDCVVSTAFYMQVTVMSLICVELMHNSSSFFDYLGNWELLMWAIFLSMYLLRFLTLGSEIAAKFRNASVIVTEQINVYLQLERKPHKKEELMIANNVLKLAESLLKEVDSPFKMSSLSDNPYVYNIIKVVLLSAFSGIVSELLGFKIKLHKIKIRA